MMPETIATELQELRQQAEQLEQSIKEKKSNLYAEQQKLRQTINEYSAKRIQFFEEALHARGLAWCTQCSAIFAESEATFMLLTGKQQYSGGYENSEYGFRDFSEFRRVCPKCRGLNLGRNGTYGEYDTLAKNQTSFFAAIVEKREDGYYVRGFKLNDTECRLSKPSSDLVEKFDEEYNLPPIIYLDCQHDEIKILKRLMSAEAV